MMEPLPGHPFVMFAIEPNADGGVNISAHCLRCGTWWQRQCHRPSFANGYVLRFGLLHAHGLKPRIRGA
jgi:hypothetical protein